MFYSWQAPLPFRLNWMMTDRVDTRVSPDTQISISTLERCEILAGSLDRKLCLLENYVGKKDLIISSGPVGRGEIVLDAAGESDAVAFYQQPFSEFHAGDLVLGTRPDGDSFFRQLDEWRHDGWLVAVLANSDGEIERFQELVPPNIGTTLPDWCSSNCLSHGGSFVLPQNSPSFPMRSCSGGELPCGCSGWLCAGSERGQQGSHRFQRV